MSKYFEKGKRLLIKKGYDYIPNHLTHLPAFKKHFTKYITIDIYFHEKEFYGGVSTWLLLIDKQEQIDEMQLAFNNLQADLKELKEIKK